VRVGIFGGTFDPPHVGHLISAADAVEALSLDRVVFVPAAAQPLKREGTWASAPQRLEMVRLLIGDDRRFLADAIEIDRPGLSYTVDTLIDMARQSPDDERFLLIGADVVRSFAQWREPLTVMQLAKLAIWRRGEVTAQQIARWLPTDAEGRRPSYSLLEARRVDVSSTEIRSRVQAGLSIRGFVPDAVREYVERGGLYRARQKREVGDVHWIDQ
jgi:nicotinate-nucleotide adenylyltransferase